MFLPIQSPSPQQNMAFPRQIEFPLVFFILSCYFFSTSLYSLVLASSINGSSIKLTQRDSPESPLYPGILTRRERINCLVHYSMARNQNFVAIPDTVCPSMAIQGTICITQIGIGTFNTPPNPPYKSYFLIVDTHGDPYGPNAKVVFQTVASLRNNDLFHLVFLIPTVFFPVTDTHFASKDSALEMNVHLESDMLITQPHKEFWPLKNSLLVQTTTAPRQLTIWFLAVGLITRTFALQQNEGKRIRFLVHLVLDGEFDRSPII